MFLDALSISHNKSTHSVTVTCTEGNQTESESELSQVSGHKQGIYFGWAGA